MGRRRTSIKPRRSINLPRKRFHRYVTRSHWIYNFNFSLIELFCHRLIRSPRWGTTEPEARAGRSLAAKGRRALGGESGGLAARIPQARPRRQGLGGAGDSIDAWRGGAAGTSPQRAQTGLGSWQHQPRDRRVEGASGLRLGAPGVSWLRVCLCGSAAGRQPPHASPGPGPQGVCWRACACRCAQGCW